MLSVLRKSAIVHLSCIFCFNSIKVDIGGKWFEILSIVGVCVYLKTLDLKLWNILNFHGNRDLFSWKELFLVVMTQIDVC